ncbi:DUF3301 domain-containing protein [Vibrio sp. SCSIO 43135]|uniref:DUF3301 domain-containing protein n=1 Tax=Vibrio paucivorans TaxID=2829489 RepID=A0A9X3CCQ8_9VIBR|nr:MULTISPECIES: DUF3301 domain-containing protein [Vibrio]MCW8333377.1 DUF3301 domain-containing protein [Vibrio paucivorans]USD41791.1 DUF3301 domain-containing protein [Vibrio sp. SCSIO 43135]
MFGDLLAILGLSFVCFLFWQQRRQSELAKAAISRKCDQLDLQLISVAFGQHKLKTPAGSWRWHTTYQFEFSALGDDCYQGELIMVGFRPMNFHLPPHRM